MSPRESSTRPFHVSHEVAPGDQWSVQTPENNGLGQSLLRSPHLCCDAHTNSSKRAGEKR